MCVSVYECACMYGNVKIYVRCIKTSSAVFDFVCPRCPWTQIGILDHCLFWFTCKYIYICIYIHIYIYIYIYILNIFYNLQNIGNTMCMFCLRLGNKMNVVNFKWNGNNKRFWKYMWMRNVVTTLNTEIKRNQRGKKIQRGTACKIQSAIWKYTRM